jgi:uncharacterized SAM-binding protein YcdF (DUF218 family)
MFNVLLILLGCNISYLLNDRIITAVNFVSTFNETSVDWFLSGGIKNPHEDTVTEAEKMAHEISKMEENYANEYRGNRWYYIYDTVATNTAENFVIVNQYLKEYFHSYDEIYIVTSKFHHNRANKIANKIIDKNVKWILGNAELKDSAYWETIHMKNIDNDVTNAINNILHIKT